MIDKELISQIKELREIKPRKDWVVLTKSRILGEASRKWDLSPIFWVPRLALAPVVSVLIIIGLFGFAQNTVPGDFLFSVKKITETVQVGLSSAVEKPGVHLRLANKRLEDLGKIAEANQVRNLAPAIEEFQANMAEAVKGLAEMDVNVTSSDSLVLREIVEETQKLEENKEKVEALGVVIGETEEFDNALAQLAERELKYLKERTLTEAQQKLLVEAEEYFEAGDYSKSLEKILLLPNK